MSTRDQRWAAVDAAVLRTISAGDWAAMFARERRGLVRNEVRRQVETILAAQQPKQGAKHENQGQAAR